MNHRYPPFRHLRAAMITAGVKIKELASMMGMSANSLSSRLSGQYEFTLGDIYKIISVLGIPASEISTFFPHNGKDDGEPETVKQICRRTENEERLIAAYYAADEMRPAIDRLLAIKDD